MNTDRRLETIKFCDFQLIFTPEDASLYYIKAIALFELLRWKEAVAAYQLGNSLYRTIDIEKAVTLCKLGQPNEALAVLQHSSPDPYGLCSIYRARCDDMMRQNNIVIETVMTNNDEPLEAQVLEIKLEITEHPKRGVISDGSLRSLMRDGAFGETARNAHRKTTHDASEEFDRSELEQKIYTQMKT